MASIDTDPGFLYNYPKHKVYVKTNLSDAQWTFLPNVYCARIRLVANAYDTAQINYMSGERVMQIGDSQWLKYGRYTITGTYVRIVVEKDADDQNLNGDIIWIGYVHSEIVEREAVRPLPDDKNAYTGRMQYWGCVGLEYFLDRVQVDSSVVYDGIEIRRQLRFNSGVSTVLDNNTVNRDNRSIDRGASGVYEFADYSEEPKTWSASDIIEYLFLHHGPRDPNGNLTPGSYELSATSKAVLAGYKPEVDIQGLSVFQALMRIMPVSRGYIWWITTEALPLRITVNVDTIAVEDVTIPTGGILPANSDKQSLDFDSQHDVVAPPTLRKNLSRKYTQIIVRGARMTSTFTVGVQDSTLAKDWKPESEAAYKDAAKDADIPGGKPYIGLTDKEKAFRNDSYRRADDFYRVYSNFRIPADWDGKSGDGGTAPHSFAIPELSPTGSILGGQPLRVQGMILRNHTRMRWGWDYADPANLVPGTPEGSSPEYQPMFCIASVLDSPELFQFVEKMSGTNFSDGSGQPIDIRTSYGLQVQQTVPGIRLSSHGGMPHSIGKDDWGGAEPSDFTPEISFQTLRATVCAEADTYCEAEHPLTVNIVGTKPVEKLTLYVGPEYRLDYLAKNTVVGLNNGVPRLTSGGILRDDREPLEDIAVLAYEWYKTERVTLAMTFRQVRNLFRLGTMITDIGSGDTLESINTVITVIDYNLESGTTRIETADGDIDIRGIIG